MVLKWNSYYNEVIHPKDADGMAYSVDRDQTAPKEQSDLSRHCLCQPVLDNFQSFYRKSYPSFIGSSCRSNVSLSLIYLYFDL